MFFAFQLYAKDVEYLHVDPDELQAMEEDGQYPPRFEVLASSYQARETVNACVMFRGVLTDNELTDGMLTELILQPLRLPGK